MDTSRVSLGEMVAAAGGVVLLVLMFLPWFGGHLTGGPPIKVEPQTGWESFSALSKFLLILVMAAAIGVTAARALGRLPSLPVEQGALVLVAGVVAFVVVLIRMLDPPASFASASLGLEVDTSRKLAAFLALAASATIAYGGYLQRRE